MRGLTRSMVLPLLVAAMPAQELTEETFAEWRDYILPGVEEMLWREIPWRPELRTALQDAREQNKPILLWAMNGHPLGCT